MLIDMKVAFNKDLFKLIDKLAGESICCATCKHFSSPASEKCVNPTTYYDYVNRHGQLQLLSFCENYERSKNGK